MKPSILSLTVLLLAVSLVLFLLALPRPAPVTVTVWDPCAFERSPYIRGLADPNAWLQEHAIPSDQIAVAIMEPNGPDDWVLHVEDANKLDDNTIRALCESGRVCAVMGHQWRKWEGAYLAIYPGPPVQCGLCGTARSSEPDAELVY